MSGSNAPVRHVILVVFDTLRRDAVGCYGTPARLGRDRDAASRRVRARVGPLRPRLSGGAAHALRAADDLHRAAHVSVPQRRLSSHQGRLRRHRAGLGADSRDRSRRWRRCTRPAAFAPGSISDLYHEFKPSKNFWRGFHQWTFIRGQEADAARSGPYPSQEEIDYWVPRELQELRGKATGLEQPGLRRALVLEPHPAQHARSRARGAMVQRAGDAGSRRAGSSRTSMRKRLFLTVESFDPHEPWFVPEHYRRRYDDGDGREQVISPYAEMPWLPPDLVTRTRANYAGLVEMCDRWFGHLIETLRVTGVLDEALVIVTSDHGHSLWERRGYIGKRGYPSDPKATRFRCSFAIRRGSARARRATRSSSITTSPRRCSTRPASRRRNRSMAGRSWRHAFAGGAPMRDHVTIGWGGAMTVIDDRWWLNVQGERPRTVPVRFPAPGARRPERRRTASRRRQAAVRSRQGRRRRRVSRLPAAAGRKCRRRARLQPVRRHSLMCG